MPLDEFDFGLGSGVDFGLGSGVDFALGFGVGLGVDFGLGLGDVDFAWEGVACGLTVGPGGRVGAEAALGVLVGLGVGDGVDEALVGAAGVTGSAVLGAPTSGLRGLELRLAQPVNKARQSAAAPRPRRVNTGIPRGYVIIGPEPRRFGDSRTAILTIQ